MCVFAANVYAFVCVCQYLVPVAFCKNNLMFDSQPILCQNTYLSVLQNISMRDKKMVLRLNQVEYDIHITYSRLSHVLYNVPPVLCFMSRILLFGMAKAKL